MKYLLRKLFRSFGFDIQKSGELQFSKDLIYLIESNNVDLVLDIGANRGQYASWMLFNKYKGRIISFEPQKKCHDLLKVNSKLNSSWKIADRVALGNEIGKVDLQVSENSVSSSILDMAEQHEEACPNSGYVKKEAVDLITLDGYKDEWISEANKIFMKMDVQGFEMPVMEGAKQLISNKVEGIQLEMSLSTLYHGETLFHDYLNYFEKLNFELCYLNPGISHEGKLMQVDGVFFKRGAKEKEV